MNSNTIEAFIKRNISNFKLNGPGWNDLIEKMLFEFCIAGWDINSIVGGKEKFGALRCYIALEDKDLEQKITNIVRKYAAIAKTTCEQCGSAARKRVDRKTHWESTLCKKCYFKNELQDKHDLPGKIDEAGLSECKICGYFAVADSWCGFCNHFSYLSDCKIYRPSAYYSTEEEYVKECQIEIFLDEGNEIELNKKIKHFRKSHTHHIRFSSEDLERFINDQKEE